MNSQTIQQAFRDLQPREKYFVSAGAVLVVIAAIYLAFLPLSEKHSQLADQHSRLQADLTWLQAQAATVPRLVNSCSGRELSAGMDRDVITRLLKRSQLRVDQVSETASGIALRFNGSDANRMVRLAHQITCEGFAVLSFEFSAKAKDSKAVGSSSALADTYVGVMEVQRVN
ncbi:type II secretion system protein M [Porticoccaceae bacterium]|nr:type II secretion system protein M [Porticoccaceae bacterium]